MAKRNSFWRRRFINSGKIHMTNIRAHTHSRHMVKGVFDFFSFLSQAISFHHEFVSILLFSLSLVAAVVVVVNKISLVIIIIIISLWETLNKMLSFKHNDGCIIIIIKRFLISERKERQETGKQAKYLEIRWWCSQRKRKNKKINLTEAQNSDRFWFISFNWLILSFFSS